MHTTKLYLLAGLLALTMAVMGLSSQVKAIEGESIVMSPASTTIDTKSGQTVTRQVTIINDGTNTYDFKVYAVPYSVSDKIYEPNFDKQTDNGDAYTWVKFAKTRYTLNPGEKVVIPYTVEVPADAAPGGHYGVLFAETIPAEGDTQSIVRQKRVGSILYATVDGQYIRSGKTVMVAVDAIQLGGHLTARVSVNNTGNVHFVATEYIQVKNIFGKIVYETTLDRVVMPKTSRDSVVEWKDSPALGLYRVKVESKVLDKITDDSKWVLLIPVWMLVVAPIVIGVLIYLAIRARRR